MHDIVLGRTLVRPRKGERKRACCWGGDHDGSHPQLPKNTEGQVLARDAIFKLLKGTYAYSVYFRFSKFLWYVICWFIL